MIRFCCAVIILAITITSAAVLNRKILKTADEILNYLEYNFDTNEIIEKWNKSKLLFSLVLNQTQTEKIQTAINNIKNNSKIKESAANLKEELNAICDSLKLNIENIL